MSQSTARHHNEWLSLIEVSGPFLSLPVLMRVFPQGLDTDDPDHARDLRMALDEWQDNQLGSRPRPQIHKAWVDFVLRNTLELPDEVIAEGQDVPQTLKATIPEHGEVLRPDIVICNPEGRDDAGKPRLLIKVYPRSQALDKPVADKRWKASPDTRMTELLHSTGVRLGLVTNGERWMLVDAPHGETTGYYSWYASLWLEERLTLRALRSLLGARRFFGVADEDTLEAMLAESARNQEAVTDQLGYQVRDAVEVLIRSLDRADRDSHHKLLADVSETQLYEAALTVMMRLVFLFCAEERELLLLGDPIYDEHYAVSTLCAQLQESADQLGEEVLERRRDAWSRLLSTFRAVYGGVQHERMRLLAYSGRLFDPDRFPFLEGRGPGTSWRTHQANPLPVDNRTVLHLLTSLQYLQTQVPGGGETQPRRLSFRTLDIEQIGHVYEGLLDHTAKRATEPIVGLRGTRNKEPEVPLAEMERLRAESEDKLVEYLSEQTGRSASALRNALKPSLESPDVGRLMTACDADEELCHRLQPFAGLIREDSFGYPVVIGEGSVYVTAGTDRRTSGTHYTPRTLTEPIVQYTLEPLVYIGPADGKPKKEWQLRSAEELLDLRVCDMACGSGAFLVQACRYLSERLGEAWDEAEKQHPGLPGITPFGQPANGDAAEAAIPRDLDERMTFARRLVAQRCLYGVDINPLAVEMAKLSLWLLTLAKDKPFEFLNHAIRPGDSLVGIRDIKQLEVFNLDGEGTQNRLILDFLRGHIQEAIELRRRITEHPADTPDQVFAQEELMRQAEEHTERLKYAADMLISADFRGTNKKERESALTDASIQVGKHFSDSDINLLHNQASEFMGGRPTLHWPLEFPEIMIERGGFDAFVCNPPFMGGWKISGNLGSRYRDYLVTRVADGQRGNADLCAYFLLRLLDAVRPSGNSGLIATNTISEGETREVGLASIIAAGSRVCWAVRSRPWPGVAILEVATLCIHRGPWDAPCTLNGVKVENITPYLHSGHSGPGKPHKLARNVGLSFTGSKLHGEGFLLDPEEAQRLIDRDPRNKSVLFPYLNGRDLNSRPDQSPSRWVINFFDWPLSRDTAPKGYGGPVAADYPECLEIVERDVKPQRAKLLGRNPIGTRRAAFWWQYGAEAKNLCSAMGDGADVLVCSEVTKHLVFCFVPTGTVYSANLDVFPSADWGYLSVMQSSLHDCWARLHSSYLRTDLKYSPGNAFQTYAFPATRVPLLLTIGDSYHEHRRQVMLDRWEGLTMTYNRFHDRGEDAEDIARLRELHVEMDYAVAAAYGWDDLDLGHDFHETRQGLRYTISEPARREVLDRLLQLNHERYAEEVAQGLHDKKKPKPKGKKKSESDGQTSIRELEDNNG